MVEILNKRCENVTLLLKEKYEDAQMILCKYQIVQLLFKPSCNKLLKN